MGWFQWFHCGKVTTQSAVSSPIARTDLAFTSRCIAMPQDRICVWGYFQKLGGALQFHQAAWSMSFHVISSNPQKIIHWSSDPLGDEGITRQHDHQSPKLDATMWDEVSIRSLRNDALGVCSTQTLLYDLRAWFQNKDKASRFQNKYMDILWLAYTLWWPRLIWVSVATHPKKCCQKSLPRRRITSLS